MDSPKTILQLSDIHFGAQHNFPLNKSLTEDTDLLDCLISDFEKLQLRPDALVISGDLTSTAQQSEFTTAQGFIRQLIEFFGLETEDVIIIPGNHDILWTRDEEVGASGNFESFVSNFYNKPPKDVAMPWKRFGDVYILGLNSTLVEKPSAGGIGLVGRDQLTEAKKCLRQFGSDCTTRILVLHHHLLPVTWVEQHPKDFPNSITLDSIRIIAWAQENGFNVILHGHQHQSFMTTLKLLSQAGGSLAIVGAPSVGGKELPSQGRNGYQIIRIDGDEVLIEIRSMAESFAFDQSQLRKLCRRGLSIFDERELPGYTHTAEPTLLEIREESFAIATRLLDVMSRSYGPQGGLRGLADLSVGAHAKDGKRIVDSIASDNQIQARILENFQSLADYMTENFGNGRKTACIVAAKILIGIRELLANAEHESLLLKQIIEGASLLSESLKAIGRRVRERDDLIGVALTAVNGNDDMAHVLVDAIERVGSKGLVQIDDASDDSNGEMEIEFDDRPTFSVRSNAWIQEDSSIASNHEDALFFVFESSKPPNDLIESVLTYAKRRQLPVFFVVQELSDELNDFCRINAKRKTAICMPISLASFGNSRHDDFTDLCCLVRAKPYDLQDKLFYRDLSDYFGTAKNVTLIGDQISFDKCVEPEITVALCQKIRKQTESIRGQYGREKLDQRLARLEGAFATIRPGGKSNAQRKLNKSLLSDGMYSLKSAIEGGVVDGGGIGIRDAVESVRTKCGPTVVAPGVKLLLDSALEPFCLLKSLPTEEFVADPTEMLVGAIQQASETARTIISKHSWQVSAIASRQSDQGLDVKED